MYGCWCVVSTEVRDIKNHKYLLVDCGEGPVWKMYENIAGGKSSKSLSSPKKYTELSKDIAKKLGKRFSAMMVRCYDTTNKSYHRYGGRGIYVEEYLQNAENYIKYVSSLPDFDIALQIDRIDNNKGYVRGNLRFVTPAINSKNLECSVKVSYKGETYHWIDFVEKFCSVGICASTKKLIKSAKTEKELEEITTILPGFKSDKYKSGKFNVKYKGEIYAAEDFFRDFTSIDLCAGKAYLCHHSCRNSEEIVRRFPKEGV